MYIKLPLKEHKDMTLQLNEKIEKLDMTTRRNDALADKVRKLKNGITEHIYQKHKYKLSTCEPVEDAVAYLESWASREAFEDFVFFGFDNMNEITRKISELINRARTERIENEKGE